jgi:hypothetical protein
MKILQLERRPKIPKIPKHLSSRQLRRIRKKIGIISVTMTLISQG